MAQSLDSDHMVAELLRAKLIARFFSRLLRIWQRSRRRIYQSRVDYKHSGVFAYRHLSTWLLLVMNCDAAFEALTYKEIALILSVVEKYQHFFSIEGYPCLCL